MIPAQACSPSAYIQHDLSAAGGELCIRYTLDIDTQLSSSNEICVRLRKRDLFNK